MKKVFECFICGIRYEMKMVYEKDVESFAWKEMCGVGASDVAKLLQPSNPPLVEEVEEGKLRDFDGKYKHDFVMESWRYKYIRTNSKSMERYKEFSALQNDASKDFQKLLKNRRDRAKLKADKEYYNAIWEKFKPTEQMLLKGRKPKKISTETTAPAPENIIC